MAIYGLAPTGWLFLIGVPVMALWGLAGPAIHGLMSRLVGPSEQGQLQGANTSLTSIAGLIGPGVFAVTFRLCSSRLPGAASLLAALILLRRARRRLVGYAERASRRPASVSLQTSQSGFSGLLNHGSAQPRVEAGLHHLGRDRLAVEIEQRQLAARLGQPAAQVEQLRQGRKTAFQLIVVQRAKR